jgi:hypothetical protein
MWEPDPLSRESSFGLVAGVSAKPNLTSNRPAENFNLAFPSSSHSFFADNQRPTTFVDTNTCLSSGHFLDAVNTSSVGVLFTEYELNTTCSLQVLTWIRPKSHPVVDQRLPAFLFCISRPYLRDQVLCEDS